MEEDNVKMCEERTGIRTLACVGDDDLALTMNADLLKELKKKKNCFTTAFTYKPGELLL